MTDPIPDLIEETMRNHQEFRMSWLTFSLGSIVCIYKNTTKKGKEKDGGKLLNYYQ